MYHYAVINIDRVGRHRKGDTVMLRIKNESASAVAEALRVFCRDYLLAPKYEVVVWTDGTWGVGTKSQPEEYGGGQWRVEVSTTPGDAPSAALVAEANTQPKEEEEEQTA